jgi:hypothetical protein
VRTHPEAARRFGERTGPQAYSLPHVARRYRLPEPSVLAESLLIRMPVPDDRGVTGINQVTRGTVAVLRPGGPW